MKDIDPHAITLSLDANRRSWERCAASGLRTDEPLPDTRNQRTSLSDRLEANARLVTYAQPIMEHLHQQIARSSSTILLADDSGVILRSVGDQDFLERAARISLKPGHSWSEAVMGTNAIGTALAEQEVLDEVDIQEAIVHQKMVSRTIKQFSGNGILGKIESSYPERYSGISDAFMGDKFIDSVWDQAIVDMAEDMGVPLNKLKSYHMLLLSQMLLFRTYKPVVAAAVAM